MVFPGGDWDSYSMHGSVDGLWSFGHKQNPYSVIGEGEWSSLEKERNGCGKKTKDNTQRNIGEKSACVARADERESLIAECGERGETATQTCCEQEARLWRQAPTL